MAKQAGGNTARRVEALVRPIVEGMGLRLWDVVFEKEGPDWYLRVLIDRDGTVLMAHSGQSLTDLPENCAALEKVAKAVLDARRREMEKQNKRAARQEEAETDEPEAEERAPEEDAPETAVLPKEQPAPAEETPIVPEASEEEPAPESDRHKELSQAAALLFGDGKDE